VQDQGECCCCPSPGNVPHPADVQVQLHGPGQLCWAQVHDRHLEALAAVPGRVRRRAHVPPDTHTRPTAPAAADAVAEPSCPQLCLRLSPSRGVRHHTLWNLAALCRGLRCYGLPLVRSCHGPLHLQPTARPAALGAFTARLAPAASPAASAHCKLCHLHNIISMNDPRRGACRYDPDTVTFRGYNETTEVRTPAMLSGWRPLGGARGRGTHRGRGVFFERRL
jgi:hypothetical protein